MGDESLKPEAGVDLVLYFQAKRSRGAARFRSVWVRKQDFGMCQEGLGCELLDFLLGLDVFSDTCGLFLEEIKEAMC